jgi:hypothetical protein
MIIISFLAAAFVAGVLVGALTLVTLAIHREDADNLPRRAPTRATAAARNVMGLHVSGAKPAVHGGLPATPAGHGDQPPAAAGASESPSATGADRDKPRPARPDGPQLTDPCSPY